MADEDPIPTRASLLERLKDPADPVGWEEFQRVYRGLILGVARRAGLTDAEAEEAVQETLITVARKMPEFRYEPGRDSFKGWLLHITRWRIADQFRQRAAAFGGPRQAGAPVTRDDDTRRTPILERVPDPAGTGFDAIWDEEWRKHWVQSALARIKRQVNPAHYAIYHLHVILGKPVKEVRRTLGVSLAQVYLAKYRVGSLLRQELRNLERNLG